MAQTSVSIRMDADLKRQFDEFCTEIGMTMTTAFNAFAEKTVQEDRIPFEMSRSLPNEETLEAMREVECMKKDPSLAKTYTNVDAMMKELLADV